MTTRRDPLRLAEFPAATGAEWREAVETGPRGRPLGKLADRRLDGLERQPLYGPGDGPAVDRFLGPVDDDGAPRAGVRPWRLGALVEPARGADAGEAVRAGADLLWVRGSDADAVRPETWIGALESGVGLVLDAGPETFLAAARAVAEVWKAGVDPWRRGGGFAIDPLGGLAAAGRLPGSVADAWRQATELAGWCDDEAPDARVVRASGTAVREAGGAAVDELAFALASGVEWLRVADAAGLGLRSASRRLRLELVVGPDIFAEIARLRAARLLWAKVVAAAGGDADDQRIWIDAVPTRTDRSSLDPWVNQLRSTGSGFAAVVGGADSVRVAAWDDLAPKSSGKGRRLAVNVQHVLAEEAHLARVADPAGGSWYLEALTDTLARAAWERFRSLEQAGGAARALGVGRIAAWVEEAAVRHASRVARRADVLVGVSDFPAAQAELPASAGVPSPPTNVPAPPDGLPDGRATSESAADASDLWLGDLFEGAVESLGDGSASPEEIRGALWTGTPARAPALVPVRWAEPWERLRQRSAALAGSGKAPQAFLASVGDVGALRARALWVANLLAAGGIAADDPDRTFASAADALETFRKQARPIAVIVSPDDAWADLLPAAAEALKEAGARRVVLAGRPPDPDRLVAWGLDASVHVGADVRAVLDELVGVVEAQARETEADPNHAETPGSAP